MDGFHPALAASEDERRIAALLAIPWEPGTHGKGAWHETEGTFQVRTWQVEPGGSPHHSVAIDRLGIPPETCCAFLGITSDGAVELWAHAGHDEATARAAVLAYDARLHAAEEDPLFG